MTSLAYYRAEVKRLEGLLLKLIECNARESHWSDWVMHRVVEQDDELKTKQAIIDGLEWCISELTNEVIRLKGQMKELLEELYHCSRQVGCDRCGYHEGGCETMDKLWELGIEVDDG